MEDLPEILNAIGGLVEALVAAFGPVGTVILLLAVVALSAGWRFYQDRRKDREFNLLIAEKDKTIQRLASQERSYRAIFFKEKMGLSDEELQMLIMHNDFSNTVEAREALEKPPSPQIEIPEENDAEPQSPSRTSKRRER